MRRAFARIESGIDSAIDTIKVGIKAGKPLHLSLKIQNTLAVNIEKNKTPEQEELTKTPFGENTSKYTPSLASVGGFKNKIKAVIFAAFSAKHNTKASGKSLLKNSAKKHSATLKKNRTFIFIPIKTSRKRETRGIFVKVKQ